MFMALEQVTRKLSSGEICEKKITTKTTSIFMPKLH